MKIDIKHNSILFLVLGLVAMISNTLYGQPPGGGEVLIVGPSTVQINQTTTYSAETDGRPGLKISGGRWNVNHGEIVSQSSRSITIRWTHGGLNWIEYDATNINTGEPVGGFYQVTVDGGGPPPLTPPTPEIISHDCNSATLQVSGTPSTGVTWYWQGTSSSGISTSNPGFLYSVTRTGRFYLRARSSTGIWSTSSSSIYVTMGVVGSTVWYADTDADGLGDPNSNISSCNQPTGYVNNNYDECPTESGIGTLSGCPSRSVNDNQYSNENYVVSSTYKVETNAPIAENDVNRITTSIQYLDGLGRPKQNLAIQAGGIQENSNKVPVDWKLNNVGSTSFYNQNGTNAENKIINGTTPFGNTDLLWECIPDIGDNADGGWNTDFFEIDNTKTYRYTVWVKKNKVGGGAQGRTYHGTQNVNALNGTPNNNPYFKSLLLPEANKWYLMVGIIHPFDYTGSSTNESGVYDVDGNKISNGVEYKWRSGLNTTRLRSYLYYTTDTSVRQYFWSPLFQQVDGGELSIQEILKSPNPLATTSAPKDIITHIKYDPQGRKKKEYLPYVQANNNGLYRTGNVALETKEYYKNKFPEDFENVVIDDVNAYSEKEFESSPLSRVLKQGAPGKDWKLENGHEIEFESLTNINRDEVRNYLVNVSLSNNVLTPSLKISTDNGGYYRQGYLSKTITKDENHESEVDHTVEEYKDKEGKVILKRGYNNGQKHDTYYIYDDYGNLTFVLPPEIEGSTASIGNISHKLNDLGYQYIYDLRNRLVEKKIPGKGWEYILYNTLDQPVLTQDANLRTHKQWLFTKYDGLGRTIYTGLYTNSGGLTRQQLLSEIDRNPLWEQSASPNLINGVYIMYSNRAFPKSSIQLHTINYIDQYEFYQEEVTSPVTVMGQSVSNRLKGLPTNNKVLVLNENKWIHNITYYDEKARPIYSYSKNDYLNTIDIVESKLEHFTGKVLETRTIHKKQGKEDIVTIDKFEYDHMDRMVSQTQKINSQLPQRIVRNHYNEIGDLEAKLVGNGIEKGYDDTIGVTINKDVITNTGSCWTSGLATVGNFIGNGYVEFVAQQNNKNLMVGLSSNNDNASYSTIDYAIYCRSNTTLGIYESGTNSTNIGNYKEGDVFRVERVGSVIHYKKNGNTFYVSKIPSTGNLIGDVSFCTTGAQIKDFIIVDNSKGLQKVDYDYNVRGWLTHINQDVNNDNDLFDFSLQYNDVHETDKRLFNGNIAKTSWKTSNDNKKRSYLYGYDALNRILLADYNTPEEQHNFSVFNILYDKNGNLTQLKRNYRDASGLSQLMDNLSYTYDNGNKLLKVKDNAHPSHKEHGFKDGSDATTEYFYDANGNLTRDWNKQINKIEYNHLNLPTRVHFASGRTTLGTINYVYDAIGTKIRKTVTQDRNVNSTDYAGNHVYENSILQFFNHPEGYVKKDTDGFNYVYQYTDHLGNIRLSYTDANNDGKIDAPSTQIFYDEIEDTVGWDSVGAKFGGSAQVTTDKAVSGNTSIKLHSTINPDNPYAHSNNWIAIDNDQPTDYIYSGWIYIDISESTWAWGRLSLFMNENDETEYFTQIDEIKVTEKNKWVYIEKRVTVPTNINKLNLRVGFYHHGTNTTVYFDDLKITRVNTVGTEIVEESNYYPFGLKHKGYNTSISSHGNAVAQKFGYNGIELEEFLGFDLYEMDVRSYDPTIARFTGIDPVIHFNQSTYTAFDNNPVYWADPSGADSESFITDLVNRSGDGKTTWSNNGNGSFSSDDGQTAIVGAEEGATEETTLSGWSPLTKSKLKSYVKSNYCQDCSTGKLENKTGNIFEGAWNDFANYNYELVFGGSYTTNTRLFEGVYKGEVRNVVPDGMANSFQIVNNAFVNIFPYASWYEVKAVSNRLYNSTNQGQLEGMITAMATVNPVARQNYQLYFNLVTTSNVTISMKLKKTAWKNKVKINHWKPEYRMKDGSMIIRFQKKNFAYWSNHYPTVKL